VKVPNHLPWSRRGRLLSSQVMCGCDFMVSRQVEVVERQRFDFLRLEGVLG